jgi:hypothetical protein
VNVFGNTVAVLLVNRFGRISPDSAGEPQLMSTNV